MILQELLTQLATLIAVTDRTTQLLYLNNAATIIWNRDDLPRSLKRDLISGGAANTISFPEHIGRVRGIRWCKNPQPVYDVSSLFVAGEIRGGLKFRLLETNPLKDSTTDLDNLTVEFASALTAPVVVTLIGSTPYADTETVVVNFGNEQITAAVSTNFTKILDIQKSLPTNSNMLVKSGAVEIAGIPNRKLRSSYLIYQLYDKCACTGNMKYPEFEVFYKPTLPRLINDEDSFPISEASLALVYYAAHLYYSATMGGTELAGAHLVQARQILLDIARDSHIGHTMPRKAVGPHYTHLIHNPRY